MTSLVINEKAKGGYKIINIYIGKRDIKHGPDFQICEQRRGYDATIDSKIPGFITDLDHARDLLAGLVRAVEIAESFSNNIRSGS